MSPGGRPAQFRECSVCLEEKPKSGFPKGRGTAIDSRVCTTCRNARTSEQREAGRIAPATELARIKARVQPNAVEWTAVQQAAERIRDHLFQKAGGASCYSGETGWAVIERVTSEPRRFHQLVTLAIVQQQAWEEERAGSIRVHGRRVPKEDVQRMAALKKDKLTITTIAARTGYPIPTVSKILRSLTEPRPPHGGAVHEREAAA